MCIWLRKRNGSSKIVKSLQVTKLRNLEFISQCGFRQVDSPGLSFYVCKVRNLETTSMLSSSNNLWFFLNQSNLLLWKNKNGFQVRKYLASSHSKLVLFCFFKGGFKENYQQRKGNIGYQVKERTLDRKKWGPCSRDSCATNNLVT